MPVARSLAFSKILALHVATVVVLAACTYAFTTPNSDSTYQQLRNLSPAGELVGVNNLSLKRDAGTFRFKSGTMCFLAPVQEKVTGAVFLGRGPLFSSRPSKASAAISGC